MAKKKKQKHSLTDTINELYKHYGKVAALLVGTITGSFWLGTYYEEVKKEREITEIEDNHAMELLKLKEEYMDKYLELREKALYNPNDSTNENKKH